MTGPAPSDCAFCSPAPERTFLKSDLVFGLWDQYAVSPGHALLIPRRHVPTWFDASDEEKRALVEAIDLAKREIQRHHNPDGYNVGFNAGAAAGQTIPHLHIHVIPRYAGDVFDPRGGIRHVIPGRGNYFVRDAEARQWVSAEHRLTTGPERPMLHRLRHDIDQAQHVDVAVAFTLGSGVDLVFEHLRDLLDRGGRLRFLTGDYLNATDPLALLRLLDLGDQAEFRIYESATGKGFHPKVYICYFGDSTGTAYIGSSNLSRPALLESIEWNFRVVESADRQGFAEARQAFDELFRHPATRALDADWIDTYKMRRRTAPPAPAEALPEPPPTVPEPHDVQRLALAALENTRRLGNTAGLVVLATGLGKTWLSAFDSHRPSEFDRVLFVAHREEILSQAQATYRRIRPDARLGLYTGKQKDLGAEVLFASVQTLGRLPHLRNFGRDEFSYIVVDEFHHAAAATYRKLIDYFEPKFLLGLTATPERTDGGDLLGLCQENLVFRCDLFDGIARGLLSPFHYYGVPDEVDYRNIPWRSSRFDPEALTNAVATEARARNALEEYNRRAGRRTLVFCSSIRHAEFMADYFNRHGVQAVAVHAGPGSAPRADSLERLASGSLKVICAVDIFNEGLDVPSVDTVMLLRPTESSVLWIQQIGRGLRKVDNKPHLTIIDYIGNHRVFLTKPRALFGLSGSDTELSLALKRLQHSTLILPPGCEVTYELRSIEILESLLKARMRGHAAIQVWYEDYRERLGVRPTASEAFREGYDPRATGAASWLEFVDAMGDLDEGALAAIAHHRDFLSALERTPMTKSFKMVTLLASLNDDAFPGTIEIGDLVASTRRIVSRSAALKEDFQEGWRGDTDLRRLLEQNPIAAWVGGRGMRGQGDFTYQGGRFKSTLRESPDDRPALQTLVREVAEWRLAEYLQRAQANGEQGTIVCKVVQADGRPILKLPEARADEIPGDWIPIVVDSEPHEAQRDTTDVTMLRKRGDEKNLLPPLLRGWFGPDAGRPGTNFQVQLRKVADTYILEPLGSRIDSIGAQVGQQYSREQIPALFGEGFSPSRWNQGFIVAEGAVVLLVTLDKSDLDPAHGYHDYFETPEVFHWQSQNRTRQASRHGKLISQRSNEPISIHLFVREQKRQAGKSAPFIYCGELEFLNWQGEQPISVTWRLRTPLNRRLADRFIRSP